MNFRRFWCCANGRRGGRPQGPEQASDKSATCRGPFADRSGLDLAPRTHRTGRKTFLFNDTKIAARSVSLGAVAAAAAVAAPGAAQRGAARWLLLPVIADRGFGFELRTRTIGYHFASFSDRRQSARDFQPRDLNLSSTQCKSSRRMKLNVLS